MINIFIPHRWNNEDYDELSALLDRSKYNVRDYSVPKSDPFDTVDNRYSVDPQIQNQISRASVVLCSNRPANNNGMALDEIEYAISIGKPIVAVKITDNTSKYITDFGIPVILKRKDSLENWIDENI